MATETKQNHGVSLRIINIIMIAVTVIVSGIVVYSTFRLRASFGRITEATETQIELENAAHELMDASDYLTEHVQRFTVNGDIRFLNEYFSEVYEANRRGEAVNKMDVDESTAAAKQKLQEAMNNSVRLMDQEYYAMRLVIEAKGYTDYPDVLKSVELSAEDAALAPDQKMRLATETVLNDEYYRQKELIRSAMKESLSEIEKLTHNTESVELASLQNELNFVRITIVLLMVVILFIVFLTSRLGINPILRAVDRIKSDSPIPEIGANEFKYLAQAYNKMYSVYRSSIEHLNFKASHDELTGAYNRAGYEILLSGIDKDTTYMLLFDIDDFKKINDTYGHEAGDKALTKLVRVLKNSFRNDDYICRVGGDEFVVFMVHVSEEQRRLIEKKLKSINEELSAADDGASPITVSVGIVHGSQVPDTASMYVKADEAMYESKRKGKNGHTFYTEDNQE